MHEIEKGADDWSVLSRRWIVTRRSSHCERTWTAHLTSSSDTAHHPPGSHRRHRSLAKAVAGSTVSAATTYCPTVPHGPRRSVAVAAGLPDAHRFSASHEPYRAVATAVPGSTVPHHPSGTPTTLVSALVDPRNSSNSPRDPSTALGSKVLGPTVPSPPGTYKVRVWDCQKSLQTRSHSRT